MEITRFSQNLQIFQETVTALQHNTHENKWLKRTVLVDMENH